MLRRRKTEMESPNSEGLRRRAKKFSQEELVDGAEQLLNNLVAYVPAYRKMRKPEILEEIKMQAESLYVLAEALLERTDNPAGTPEPSRQVRGF